MFTSKRIIIHSLPFLEWLIVTELEHFLELDMQHLGSYKLTVEYGYYQNDDHENGLGLVKQFTADDQEDFSEMITSLIMGYARHMMMNQHHDI